MTKLTEKQYKKLLRKKKTKKLTKRESKRLNNELDRRYYMCVNKLKQEYKNDTDIYSICNYSISRKKKLIKKKNI